MTLIYFLTGVLLVFWGGFDLAQYLKTREKSRAVYAVITTALGLINLISALGVVK